MTLARRLSSAQMTFTLLLLGFVCFVNTGYGCRQYQLQNTYYLLETQWSNDKYEPSFKEHEEVSVMSSGLSMLILVALMGYKTVATKKVFEWTSKVPDMVRAGAQITRFLNDIASYKLGKNKNDMASSVECYMLEKGLSGDEAMAAIAAMIDHRWRVVNRACIEMDCAMLPVAQLVVNLARTNEVIYLHGRDAYTSGHDLKDLISALFLNPIHL